MRTWNPSTSQHSLHRKISFFAGCQFELALLAFAFLWSRLFDRPFLVDLHWSLSSSLIGIVASIPPFLFFLWTLNSRLPLWFRHKQTMESYLGPIFGSWSALQLTVISIIAGISEEAFFRGAIQGSLADHVGVCIALVMASLLFGAFHLITWTYAIITAFIGVYLGLLWIWTGNLLTPMITHAVYDIAALVYLLKIRRPG
jgi:uncharacterized protein